MLFRRNQLKNRITIGTSENTGNEWLNQRRMDPNRKLFMCNKRTSKNLVKLHYFLVLERDIPENRCFLLGEAQ